MLTLTETRSVPHVTVFHDRCAGCEECVVRCPTMALSMDNHRWIAKADDELCVGCRQCVRTCPFSAISVTGPLVVADRIDVDVHLEADSIGYAKEVRSGLTWETAISEAERCVQCPDPTCVRGCPAHNDIPMFIAAIRDRDLQSAHQVLRRTSILPDICSRVCDWNAQCEGACTWHLAGGRAVSIGSLERFITDHEPTPECTSWDSDARELSVAIVGAGPAGAAAAWELIGRGARVTMFERDEVPGGLTRWGIPLFSLPDEVANRPWTALAEAGLDLHTNTEITPAQLIELRETHDAVILANGAPLAIELEVPGADLPGVETASTFLQRTRTALLDGDTTGLLNRRVVIIGGGNTALDVGRMALRVGASAIAIEWLTERFAHERLDQLQEARTEGVEVRFATELISIDGNDRVETVTVAPTKQSRADRPPKVVKGKFTSIEADIVVFAVGYRLDASWKSLAPRSPSRSQFPAIPDRRWTASGILATDSPVGKRSYERHLALLDSSVESSPGVWVIGDALTGAATGTVVAAMAQGTWTARSLINALNRPTA